jgi:tRNA C32,U32 (ribose-2'-O)-methylase TrmJ
MAESFQPMFGYHVKKPSKSSIVNKQPTTAIQAEEMAQEVNDTYNKLEKMRKKIIESDPDRFQSLTIKDLIVKDETELIILMASRMKKRIEQSKQHADLWKNINRYISK